MHYYIKPKFFFDSLGDVQPSQPYSYTYGDRPVFEFSFLPNEIAEGDTLVFAVDNDMVFYDNAPENLLHSASCMVVVRHDVTAEEATAGKVQLRIETRTVKFRDVTNGKVRPVEVISGLYRRRGDGDDLSYVLMARGRAFANGIIADYDALPEPITIDEYYTKGDIDGLLGEKADAATLVAHTDNADIHVTLQDKSTWDSKAVVSDIGNATVTITQGGVSKGSFSVNASENVTIEVNDGAQADWNETDTSSPSYIQNKPSVYTQTETDGMLNAKADKATTIAGYGITDAYTKTEVDAKVTSVYRYRGTVSAYADLPSSGQEVGDVWNIETADSTHGIKAGDNVAWNGTTWDVLAGEIDLTAYPTKSELATVATTGDYNDLSNRPDLTTKLDAPAVAGTVGQVLTKTADGVEWADPAGGGSVPDASDYLCFTADEANDTISLNKVGTPSTISLEYSVDKKTWTEYTWDGNTGATITLANVGDRVWWRGDNNTLAYNYDNHHQFKISLTTKASGNIMSLLDKKCNKNTVPEYCFSSLFNGCTSLTTAPELPATTLMESSYYNMFGGSGIVAAPELPATTLGGACYRSMFNGCTSLTTAPELPATTLANWCYVDMFKGCTSLTTAPELPATTLANRCYGEMFNGCTSLTTAPKIYAKSGDDNSCNSMFYNCTSLTEATVPNLNLNISNVDTVLHMFYGCTSLKHLKVYFTNWDGYGTYVRPWDSYKGYSYWLGDASLTGVFECPSALDCSIRDKSYVPAGWTIVRTDSPKSITSPTTASSKATYEVSPNTPSVPVVTVTSALTLNASTIGSGSITYAEIVLDVASGATVTAGTNLTLVDEITAGKRNICVVRWSNGVAKLYVTIVEDQLA